MAKRALVVKSVKKSLHGSDPPPPFWILRTLGRLTPTYKGGKLREHGATHRPVAHHPPAAANPLLLLYALYFALLFMLFYALFFAFFYAFPVAHHPPAVANPLLLLYAFYFALLFYDFH